MSTPVLYRPRAADKVTPVVPCSAARGYQSVRHAPHVWHPSKNVTVECGGVR